MRILRRSRTAALLAGLAVAAGCAPGGTAGGSPPSSTSAPSEVQILALAKEVAQCVRQNGLPGFPDPYFENGELKLPPVDDNVKQQGQAALDGPCKDKWQQLQPMLSKQQGDARENREVPSVAPGDLDKLKLFTDCMRQHGFANWPDPDGNGTYHLGPAGLPEHLGKGDRPEDKTFRDALDACQPFSVPGMGFENQ